VGVSDSGAIRSRLVLKLNRQAAKAGENAPKCYVVIQKFGRAGERMAGPDA